MSARVQDILISAEDVGKEFRFPQGIVDRLSGKPPLSVHALNGVSF